MNEYICERMFTKRWVFGKDVELTVRTSERSVATACIIILHAACIIILHDAGTKGLAKTLK